MVENTNYSVVLSVVSNCMNNSILVTASERRRDIGGLKLSEVRADR